MMFRAPCRSNGFLRQRHTAGVPYFDKMTRTPGRWGAHEGPPRDSLGLRMRYVRERILTSVGKLTKPFRTPRAVYLYRKIQTRIFTAFIATLVIFIALQVISFFVLMLYSAYSVSPSTPILQRKAHEHRVGKQIMTMVRKRELEIAQELSEAEAKQLIHDRDARDSA